MRDFGADDIPETGDDILNIATCQSCHPELTDFDRITTNFPSGVQTEIKNLLTTLSNLLQGSNHGYLPSNQPGKCARCHKGGTVPFPNDTFDVLENAYTNYKLMLNDRSWGIHNTGYIKKLLQDSIDSIIPCNGDFDCNGNVDSTDATSFLAELGRSPFHNPCTNEVPCYADFNCDEAVDAGDVGEFIEDFGRSQFSRPCPPCEVGAACVYP